MYSRSLRKEAQTAIAAGTTPRDIVEQLYRAHADEYSRKDLKRLVRSFPDKEAWERYRTLHNILVALLVLATAVVVSDTIVGSTLAVRSGQAWMLLLFWKFLYPLLFVMATIDLVRRRMAQDYQTAMVAGLFMVAAILPGVGAVSGMVVGIYGGLALAILASSAFLRSRLFPKLPFRRK